MVSLAILALVMTGMAGVFYGALRTASASNHRTVGVAISIAAIETMRAVPYDQLGFSDLQAPPATFEGFHTVSVTSPQVAPTSTEAREGITYSSTRNIVWADAADAGTTRSQAYKRVTAIVTWTDAAGSNTVRQDSIIYPGGRGAYTRPGGGGPTTTAAANAPPSPEDLVATVPSGIVGESTVALSWTASPAPNPAVSEWVIQYSTSPVPLSWDEITSAQPVSNTAFDVTGLSPGTTYYFRVLAAASNGSRSDPSNLVQATTNPAAASACQVGTLTATPSLVSRVNGNSGKLTQDISVVANTSGSCTALQVRYVTDSNVERITFLTASSGGAWRGSLSKDDKWSLGNHAVNLYLGTTFETPAAQANVCVKQSNAANC